MDIPSHHEEVLQALTVLGDPRYGESVRVDRGSEMPHLGITFPALRKRVAQGFSFYGLPAPEVLAAWDGLWKYSLYGDILFAAIEYYRARIRKLPPGLLWPVLRTWIDRVDNWCHCDSLGGLYSWLLAADHDAVYPQLVAWNRDDRPWHRRISLVSLIHYSGKNAVFLPLSDVLPLITACLGDERPYVQKAVGWVLRETANVYPAEVTAYLEEHAGQLSALAMSRAIERMAEPERHRLRALRTASSHP